VTPLAALWLPVLLSAVAVFVLSSLIHMVSPWHKGDYPRIPEQEAVMDALRPFAIPPGDYLVPRPVVRADLKSPEFTALVNKGPNLIVTVMKNGPRPMGGIFVLWFLYLLFLGLCAAYLTGAALPAGAAPRSILKFVGLISFIGYGAALWQMSIWFHRQWSTSLKATVDAVIYAVATAGIFIWLWPK
jgi:hypothetical protein